ncbi:MAG TPA: hypothetical protein VGN17_05200 [Bryobacteraceae bacterium]|jgi:hypothetical protein
MPVHNNELLDDPLIFDEQISFGGGMNSNDRPNSLAPNEAQLILNGRLFSNERCKKRIGHSLLATVTAAQAIQGMKHFKTPTVEKLLIACNAQMKSFDGVVVSGAIGTYVPTAGAQVHMAQLADLMLLVDGVQNVYSWDGAAFTQITGVNTPGAGYKYIVPHTERVFVLNYNNPVASSAVLDQVHACDLLDPTAGHWQNQFSFRVGGDGKPITGACPWFQFNLAVFKLNRIYVVNADPTATSAGDWTINKTSDSIGCCAHRTAVQCNDVIAFLSYKEGVRLLTPTLTNDGRFSVSDPISKKIQDWIERINWAFVQNSSAVFRNNTYRLSVPIDASQVPNYTLVYNFLNKAWEGPWSIGARCSEITEFNSDLKLVLGMDTGKLLVNNDYKGEQNLVAADFQDDGADYDFDVLSRSMNFRELKNPKTGDYCELELENLEDSGENTSASAILDEDTENEVKEDFEVETVDLPVDLPFDLKKVGIDRYAGDLMQFGPFREMAIKIHNTKGNCGMRSMNLAGYLDTVEKELTP